MHSGDFQLLARRKSGVQIPSPPPIEKPWPEAASGSSRRAAPHQGGAPVPSVADASGAAVLSAQGPDRPARHVGGCRRIRHLIRTGKIVGRLDDPEIQSQLRTYINQLNFIATLRARQLGDELVKDLFYEAATSCREHCAKPFVREIRETQNDYLPRSCRNGSGLPILESLPDDAPSTAWWVPDRLTAATHPARSKPTTAAISSDAAAANLIPNG